MTTSVDEDTDRVAKVIDAFVFSAGTNGPTVAAMAVLADHRVAAGLAALPLLERLDREHQHRAWGDGSTGRSCTCGVPGCRVRETLDQAPT